MFQKLDKSKLTNIGNMWDKIMETTAKFDPGNEHAMNYMWGTTGIGYNVDAVKERLGVEEIDSWEVIFNPEILSKFADCGVHMLDASDICLAVGWSGDVLQARDRADEADNGVHVSYAIPKEGALAWFDMMAIPSDAPHPDEAHAFINYLMDAQVMAKASNYVYYANGNKASQEFLEEDEGTRSSAPGSPART